MRYIADTPQTVEQATQSLRAAVAAAGFTTVHACDLRAALGATNEAGPRACWMLGICNAEQAAEMLRRDMDVAPGVVCQLAVYDDAGQTRIALLRPTRVLGALSGSPARMDIAKELEHKCARIIDAAVGADAA